MSDQQLAEKLHTPVIDKNQKIKKTVTFYRQYLGCWSCWYASNKKILYKSLFFIIFLKNLDESNHKPNKMLVDKSNEFTKDQLNHG